MADTAPTHSGAQPGLLKRLRRWLFGASGEPAKEEDAAKPKSETEQAVKSLADMRTLLRQTGAAFATAAGVILAGLGWTQVHQMFPLPELEGDVDFWLFNISKDTTVLVLAAAGAAAAFGGAAWFASRFFAAQRRILLSAKRGDCQGLDEDDKAARDRVYRGVAAEEVAPSLHALELRSYRLARTARALPEDDPKRKQSEEETKRLQEVVDKAIHWAGVAILERRSATAFSGPGTVLALGLAIAGIILVFGLADYAKGQRDLIELRATCQAAVAKGATDACDTVRDSATVAALKKAEDDRKKAAKGALDKLRKDLPPGAQGRLQRLEACATLLATHDALSGEEEAVKAAIVQACENLTAE